MTIDWNTLEQHAAVALERSSSLDDGQRASLAWIVKRLRQCNGLVLADEVGTGKTRIACALIHAVLAMGGRIATVVPKGLMHQWLAESRELDASVEATSLTTLPELFRSVSSPEHWRQLAPHPDRAEWCLLSHNFRIPQVRANSHTWRAALPALVELQLAPKTVRSDRRTREGRLDERLAAIEERATKRGAYWRGMAMLAKDVASRIRPRADLRRAMRKLPDIRILADNTTDVDLDAYRDAEGDRISEEILGAWLGDFDLIVVDEAHKSRGQLEEDDASETSSTAKILTRLLGHILQPADNARRLCLTATPMELELDQWRDLLLRASCDLGEQGKQVIAELKAATRDAAVAPDETKRLDRLCRASTEFTRTLSPYVTRRRRTDDGLLQEIQSRGEMDARPHPHRNVEAREISWSDPDVRKSPWIDVLFAAECMSHAARGLTKADTKDWPHAIRDAYTKLCKGHVSADFFDDVSIAIPAPSEADEHTRGKIIRVNYWYKHLRAARERIAARDSVEDGLVECEHPRITLAVREIEAWTQRRIAVDGLAHGEKVLVFGVFLHPLRVLRNVLNVRHALRAVDAGRPIAHSLHRNALSMSIARRQLDGMKRDRALGNRLRDSSESSLRDALHRGHEQYTALQTKLRGLIAKTVETWTKDPRRLGGIDDRRVLDDVRAHAMAFVLDELLNEDTAVHSDSDAADLAEVYFQRYLAPEITDLDAREDDEDPRTEALRGLFNDEDTRQRQFAVLLAGDTQASTRRYIQAAFNRRTSSPRVLIAQSQVGREGLNLHEACRVVIQFHAEWNPAILEQQIGRVDRKNSLWERLARQWLTSKDGDLPRVEVRQLVFEGTYDAFQWERVTRRKRMFDASLFGTLLPEEAWARVPPGFVNKLRDAAPSFRPPGYADGPRSA
jgi:superfamily II DNA or RNA helicase